MENKKRPSSAPELPPFVSNALESIEAEDYDELIELFTQMYQFCTKLNNEAILREWVQDAKSIHEQYSGSELVRQHVDFATRLEKRNFELLAMVDEKQLREAEAERDTQDIQFIRNETAGHVQRARSRPGARWRHH